MPPYMEIVLSPEADFKQMLKFIPLLVYIVPALVLLGCSNDALIKENQQQLERQQAELDQLKNQLSRLEAQRPAYNYPSPPPGSCESNIMREATRNGGERFAAGDFDAALNYYQDALTAC